MSKTVRVEYFAQARLATGVARESIDLDDDANLDHLIQALVVRHGEPVRRLLCGPDGKRSPGLVVAIGERQIAVDEPGALRDGDQVVLVPAISGG